MSSELKPFFAIGIDCGKNTGIAVWDKRAKAIKEMHTVAIHRAMEMVMHYAERGELLVRVEDARLRKWFGDAGREQLQGAGSVKRDATIWEDFLTDKGIAFQMVAPKNNKTKKTSREFKALTGWKERTTEHSRDAAMLVVGW